MKRLLATATAIGALAASAGLATAQTKVTNQGISDTEIVIGSHQDLSGPIKGWGTAVANGMKLAVEEINAAGGIHGRKIKMILEDSGYDPKKAVLATQKMIEKDKIFVNIGSMGSPTVIAAQDITLDAGVPQLFPLTAAEFTYKFDPAKPQERLKFNNLLPYVESTRAAAKHMIETFKVKKPCVMLSGRRVRQERARRLHGRHEGPEDGARLRHDLQAWRDGFQRQRRQAQVRRLRDDRHRRRHPRADRPHG